MATSSQQTYIAKLGFQDPDRSKDRHGLACEYLFERLLELEAAPAFVQSRISLCKRVIADACDNPGNANLQLQAADAAELLSNITIEQGLAESRSFLKPSECINRPISSGKGFVSGFADVLLEIPNNDASYSSSYAAILGEVKITRQPAEQILQQINFYKSQLKSLVRATYVLTDYDCADLQRIAQGSDVKVFRLGQRFEHWLATRHQPSTQEL